MASPPILIKPIPPQVVNEGAAWGPINLNEFIQSPNPEDGVVHFLAELINGASLPNGLICTDNGTLSGIPAANTQGTYDVLIVAENDSGLPFTTQFQLTIKERIAIETVDIVGNLKSRVWEALGKDLPIPDIGDIFNRPITAIEIYYLLQRWATITVWDVYNLDAPGEKILLELKDSSEHYNVYDRGSCIIGAPKDLYSHKRTLADALQTSRAIAREVYKRGWAIEFAGFDKMVRAAWVELQLLGEQFGKPIDIYHFEPSADDLKVFSAQSRGPHERLAPE